MSESPSPRRGRPKGAKNRRSAEILELAERLNADPVDLMLKIISATTVELAQTDGHGNVILDAKKRPVLKHVAISLEQKLDAAKAVAPYLYARLQATQVTGQIESVQVHTQLPIDALLARPELLDAISDISMLCATQGWMKPPPDCCPARKLTGG